MNLPFRQTIQDLLKSLPSDHLPALKQLFWSELNYDRSNDPVSTREWSDDVVDLTSDPPIIFATAGHQGGFRVIYTHFKKDQLLIIQERQIIKQLHDQHPYALYIFSNSTQENWHFVNIKYDDTKGKSSRRVHRRITISPDERLRTATERISLLDVAGISLDLLRVSPLAIQQRHDEAFDVEKVTQGFFKAYCDIFRILRNDLQEQSKDIEWAHDYALQFLNRVMFLYYVQRKRWLDNDSDFIAKYWRAYRSGRYKSDSFLNDWLYVMFFEAFNNQFSAGRSDRQYFPEWIRNTLQLVPFLNGGLFTRNDVDRKHKVNFSDARFESVFNFFESYNFTISEDTPLDQEVAVDPEMIGKVYESLVNVSDEADERGEAGIFYTPRVEIDLMCRLTVVDWLSNLLGEDKKSLIYEIVFAFEEEDKRSADERMAERNLWSQMDEYLHNITIVDPACGSGSFLVGMLYVLNDLIARANHQLGRHETAYDRKRSIIRDSLYGVDVMRWAVEVAELRLWLTLVIDTDLKSIELQVKPLLPHLSFKIRPGDSLVQEIGGVDLAQLKGGALPANLINKVNDLKVEKKKFFNGDEQRKYRTNKEVEQAEFLIFREILGERIRFLENRVHELAQRLRPQENLFGEVLSSQIKLDAEQSKRELEQLSKELENAKRSSQAIKSSKEVPFVWDIAFVEIFESDTGGFDIVIGNPPYVRQGSIHDPLTSIDEVTISDKRAYKAKLARSVYTSWPSSFDYNFDTGKPKWKLDYRSDLYIFFYFYGLSLLNKNGAFSFITSNSWLDVGYGKDLQKFLLSRGKIKFIIDNQARRSFASADINTIIVLFSSPKDSSTSSPECLDHISRFVMLKVPFEQTLDPIIWEEIEETNCRKSTIEYRVLPIKQSDLRRGGFDVEKQIYSGDKWGGKYLRAPEVYFSIMEKSKDFLVPLSDYFRGERYLNTGGADGFFILSDVNPQSNGLCYVKNKRVTDNKNLPFEGYIEEEFLKPLIKDFTKKNKKIVVSGFDSYCLVVSSKPSRKLRAYIEWGELQGYHKRSVTKTQNPWYRPTRQMIKGAKILVPRSFNDSYCIYYNFNEYLSLRYYRLHHQKGNEIELVCYLNSTFMAFILETLGNKNLGQGVLDFFMADFLSLRLPVILRTEFNQIFSEFGNRPINNIWEELGVTLDNGDLRSIDPLPDRKVIDDVIFDAIGLTVYERDAVYESLIDQVETRLKKATSLKTRKVSKELSEMEW